MITRTTRATRWAGLLALIAALSAGGCGRSSRADSTPVQSNHTGGAGGGGGGSPTGSNSATGGGGASTCDCPPGSVCQDGACPVECDIYHTQCPGRVCADFLNDAHNCGGCGSECPGQACRAGACAGTVIAPGQRSPGGIALDNDHVYWTNSGSGTVAGGVFQAPKTGNGALAMLAPFDGRGPIAVDAENVYWLTDDGTTASIVALPLSGGTPGALYTEPGGDPLAESAMAAHDTSVYWVDHTGEVRGVPIGGGNVVTFAKGQNDASVIAVDDANIYIANRGTLGAAGVYKSDGGILQIPKDGSAPIPIASGQNQPSGIAVDGANVYFTDFGSGAVMRVPIGGGAATMVGFGQAPSAIAIDDTNVYFTDAARGTVMKVPKAGGAAVQISGAQSNPVAIVVDDANVYWLDWGTSNSTTLTADGSVSRAPK